LWWVDFSWLPDAHPDTLLPYFSAGQREKIEQKSSWVEIRTENYLSITLTGKIDSSWGN